MFTWFVSKSVKSNATPEKIWHLYADVINWPRWDSSLEWSSIDAQFVKGTKGHLKPKDWSKSEFIITEMTKQKSFSITAYLPLTTMTFEHTLIKQNSQTVITHTAKIKGLLAPILYLVLRKKLLRGLDDAVTGINIMAEKD